PPLALFTRHAPATTARSTLSLHDALPICSTHEALQRAIDLAGELGDEFVSSEHLVVGIATVAGPAADALSRHGATPDTLTAAFEDRKSTRLNSSHVKISYAVFCLKKKKTR